jgi:hypothetical protein
VCVRVRRVFQTTGPFPDNVGPCMYSCRMRKCVFERTDSREARKYYCSYLFSMLYYKGWDPAVVALKRTDDCGYGGGP